MRRSKTALVRINFATFSQFGRLYSLHSVTKTRASDPSRQSYGSSSYFKLVCGPIARAKVSKASGSCAETCAPFSKRAWIIVMAGASRTSSVPGLKARPQTAIFLSFKSLKCLNIFRAMTNSYRYTPSVCI